MLALPLGAWVAVVLLGCGVADMFDEESSHRPTPDELPIATVIATYRRHAIIYADRTRTAPSPRGWATLERMACIVAGGGPALGKRFTALLDDPDPAIRFPAAVHALQYDIDTPAALATLRAMVGRVLEDGTADGPAGPDYASMAPTSC